MTRAPVASPMSDRLCRLADPVRQSILWATIA
jgi:hypothetical protein